MTLKVLTLNLWNDEGPYDRRRQLIRGWIERLDPDVIGFQEVLFRNGRSTAADMVTSQSHIADGPAAPFWLDATARVGNAIASKWPIVRSDVHALPGVVVPEDRLLTAHIDAPFGDLFVACTHLTHGPEQGVVRERQVVEIARVVENLTAKMVYPPIILGDFNAEPTSSEVRFMQGHQSLEGCSVRFTDAWSVGGDPGPGITWARHNEYASFSLWPDQRIDYIFVGQGFHFSPHGRGLGQVESAQVVCDEQVDGVWPSDHFGVFGELNTEPVLMSAELQEFVRRASSVGVELDGVRL